MPGSMARDKRVLRNLDDEIYRIAPKTYAKGAKGRNAVKSTVELTERKHLKSAK